MPQSHVPWVVLSMLAFLALLAAYAAKASYGIHGAQQLAVLATAGATSAFVALSRRQSREKQLLVVESTLDERDEAILELLRSRGPMGVSDVARSLGISKSIASRKLRKLADMGLVERIVVDGSPQYRVRTTADKKNQKSES